MIPYNYIHITSIETTNSVKLHASLMKKIPNFNVRNKNSNSKIWSKTPNTMLWVKLNSFLLNQIANWIYIGINSKETLVIWNPYIHAHPWHASHPKSASENNDLFLQLHVHIPHKNIFTRVQFKISLIQITTFY